MKLVDRILSNIAIWILERECKKAFLNNEMQKYKVYYDFLYTPSIPFNK